ncbi:MAG: hypothetical protein ACI8W8_003833 [Rhodothermales bacterium]|jgi:hypothetical protein
MADLTDVVCPNHPSEPAVAKCHGCFKPACKECVKKINGRDYCSVECAANDARTQQNIDKNKKGFLGKLIKPIIGLVVVGGLAYAGKLYLDKNPDALKKGQAALEEQANKVKKKVSTIDLGAKGEIEDVIKLLETSVKEGDFNAAKAVFSGSCSYTPFEATGTKRASAFLQMCKANRATDFVIHTSDFKFSEKQAAYGVIAELHFITREQTGPRNRIVPVRFIFKKTSDKWTMVSIKETGKLQARR